VALCHDSLAMEPELEVQRMLRSRIDYHLGLHKFYGYASLPRDVGLLSALWPDFFVLLAVAIHRRMLISLGIPSLFTSAREDSSANPTPPPSSEESRELQDSASFLSAISNDRAVEASSSAARSTDDPRESPRVDAKAAASVDQALQPSSHLTETQPLPALATLDGDDVVHCRLVVTSRSETDRTAVQATVDLAGSADVVMTDLEKAGRVDGEGGANTPPVGNPAVGGKEVVTIVEFVDLEEVGAAPHFSPLEGRTAGTSTSARAETAGLPLHTEGSEAAFEQATTEEALEATFGWPGDAIKSPHHKVDTTIKSPRRDAAQRASKECAPLRTAHPTWASSPPSQLPKHTRPAATPHALSCFPSLTEPADAKLFFGWLLNLVAASLVAVRVGSLFAALFVFGLLSLLMGWWRGKSFFSRMGREVCAFRERLLPVAYHSKGSDTDLSMPSFAISLVIWLLVLFAFPLLSEGASSGSNLGNPRFDSSTIGVLFFVMGVMVCDRIIYRLWLPPIAIDPSLRHSSPHAEPGCSDSWASDWRDAFKPASVSMGSLSRRMSSVRGEAEPTSVAPSLKLALHCSVTLALHTITFAMPLWRCASWDKECGELAAAPGLSAAAGMEGCGSCSKALVVQLFYALASIYLLLSASQLRVGFPLVPQDHPLTESGAPLESISSLKDLIPLYFDFIGCVLYKLYLFRGFLQVPFLWEIRAILDWTVANTSLEHFYSIGVRLLFRFPQLFSYIKLEDIHTGLCIVRANMLYRRAYKRGVAIPKLDKSYMGFLAVLALLLVVTGPLLIFSSASPISEPNPLVGASARLSLIAAPRAALARTSRGELDHSHSDFEIASISRLRLVALDPHHALLTNEFHLHHCQDARSEVEIYRSCGYRYLFGDSSDNFQRLQFEKEADLHWQITPGSRRALAQALIQSSVLEARFGVDAVKREMQVEVSLQVTFERALAIGGSTRNSLARTRALSKSQKEQLFRALIPSNGSSVRPAVVRLELRELFPKFVRLPSVAEAEPFAITGTMHQWHTWQTLALSWRS
ncbi:MAG: hypothetical protein SGPRY_005933, partial [Prymnesium sp.]